jgi:CotH kinase protein
VGNDWLLYPSYDDKTFLNNVLTEEMFRAMGHYAVRCKYTELFLRQTAGKLTAADYAGIYVLIERIRIANNRVNIAKLGPTDNAPPAVTGGYLFSKDRPGTNGLVITTTRGEQLNVLDPDPAAITPAQSAYLLNYLNTCEGSLYGANWRDPLTGYAAYIDADSCVDQHWIVEYPKNIDGYRLSNYMNKDRNSKLKMEPIWDWDLSWGNANYADGGHTNGWYYTSGDIWLGKLRTDPDFYQKIIDRWGALRLSVFNATNLFARIDQVTNQLWEAQARDFKRWPRLGTYVWPNPNGAAGGWDVDYVTPTNYSGIIAQFKKFVLGRYLWVDQQFLRAPTLTTNGGVLSMSAPAGTIYYTLDNSDPRGSGGQLNPSAAAYQGAIPLTNTSWVFARAFYTNTWSPPAKIFYSPALPALRITEINYHPVPPPTNSPYQDKDFEFIEIQNTGTSVINLAGARLGGGIDFTFSPNEYRPAGTATWNNFDDQPNGTSFTASTLGQLPGPCLTNDGPAGNLLCLLNSGADTARNRVAFNQTATGSCDRVVAEFDFRAGTISPAAPAGGPTLQDFDSAGTPYSLTHAGSNAPAVLPADGGSAGSFLRLVSGSAAQFGIIAFDRSATGVFNSVVATFDFRITPPAGASPANGLGFALLDTSAYGTSGAGPYFAQEPNLANSIGVGFDVYSNASTPYEPNGNHVSLHWNNSQIGNAVTPSFNLASGRFHRAQIIVRFWSNNTYVTVRLTPDINGSPGPTETVLENALIPGVAPYQGRVAFGAQTGGAWAAHDLDNINVQFAGNTAASAGLSLLFLPAAQFGTAGPGTTLANFSDWPLVSNTLALALCFNPSNLFNDVSLYWNGALATNVNFPASALDLDAGTFSHVRLELDGTNGGGYASLALTPDSLGTPGSPINVLSNSFITGAALGRNRLEFAGHNGGLSAKVDLENVLATFEALAPMLLNPGESIVVVHNRAAFISRYGTGIRIAGEFSGSLDNAGERLTLLGPLGEPILDFSYDPSWYPITDGGGFSLVAADPTAPPGAWGQAGNWRPSSRLGGSPGSTDPPRPPAVLGAILASGNALRLAWPASSGTFNLGSAASPEAPAGWTRVTDPPVLLGDRWVVTLSVTDRASFYRLQGQPASLH